MSQPGQSRVDGRSGDDFAGYVAARWPELVRTLVLLGCPEDLAADVALDALARCQRDWSRTREESGVDEVVRDELLAAWERRRTARDPWWEPTGTTGPARTGPARPTPGGAAELTAALDRLEPALRRTVVLERFLGASTTSTDPGDECARLPSGEQLRSAAALVPVLAPPSVEQIAVRRRQDSRRRARRATRLTAAGVVPLVAVAAGLTWVANRAPAPAPDALSRLTVTRVDNPTNVVWEAGGIVHLPHGTVPVPVLRQLAPFGTGALYADRQGRVVEVAADGVRTVLGHADPATGFVSSDARGWAAWVDPTGKKPQVVVVDVTADRVIGRLDVADGQHPVAISDDTVFLADAQGVRGWQPLRQAAPASVVEPASLVAASSVTRVYQSGHTRLQVSPYLGIEIAVTGVGGRLSTDGGLLATRTSGEAGGDGPVAIYDTTTGNALKTGVADSELALDVTLGPDQTVTYLIARKVDRPQADDQLRASFAGALQLRTCRLFLSVAPPSCDLVTDIPVSGISPMLGH